VFEIANLKLIACEFCLNARRLMMGVKLCRVNGNHLSGREKETSMRYLTKEAIKGLATYLRFRLPVWGMIAGLLVLMPYHTAKAQCASILSDGDFEEQRSDRLGIPWTPEGRAAIDPKRGLSYRGDNNAWAGKKAGWSGFYHYPTRLSAGREYVLTAFVKTSGDVHDGYFGFRDKTKRPVIELKKFGPLPNYKELTVKFRPATTGLYNVFIGFWAPTPESWIRVDLMRLDSGCQDVNANPGER
jgi:hypothetical protein